MIVRWPEAKRQEFLAEYRRLGHRQEAADAVGVGQMVGWRWLRETGGVIRIKEQDSGHRLSWEERDMIQELAAQDVIPAEIARRLGRHRSTICRELKRHRRQWHDRVAPYSAQLAQLQADRDAARPKATRLSENPRLVEVISQWMSGPSRMSPEQVAHRLPVEFPDDESMRISHETIYQELYVQGRGHLRADLHKQLRTGRARRTPRVAAKRPRVPGELLIANRPKDVDERSVPGHWEGDLIIGKNSGSAIGTLVERHTRFVILLHLPHGRDAAAVADQIADQMARLPEHLRQSLTWDQGTELIGGHARITAEQGLTVWFCDPASPWQRGSNENTNGLLRQYFPKGTDLSIHDRAHLDEVAAGLNARPRKTLGWRTPAEALNEILEVA